MTYRLRSATSGAIEVFNAAGSLVRRLETGPCAAGESAVEWDGRDERGNPLASGIYLARIVSAGGVATGRIVITR